MPELPEVETTRRGLVRLLVGRTISSLVVREPRLRWRVAPDLAARLTGRRIGTLERRGKYLLFGVDCGALVVHLGMSGSLRYLQAQELPRAHDHVDVELAGGGCLRFNDPRRFGSFHYAADPLRHPLLEHLGPEPLGDAFTADYLWRTCRGRRGSIKQHLMNGRIVVGVGNIYANEALFRARIRPSRAAGSLSHARVGRLVDAVRSVLEEALLRGGTTLRDYVNSDGRPGYFQLSLDVYGRGGAPCTRCGAPLRCKALGQRATYYCPRCQR